MIVLVWFQNLCVTRMGGNSLFFFNYSLLGGESGLNLIDRGTIFKCYYSCYGLDVRLKSILLILLFVFPLAENMCYSIGTLG